MPKLFAYLLFICLLAGGPGSYGQDTIPSLPLVTLTDSRLRTGTVGSPTERWTASELANLPADNIAELLARHTTVYLKDYGPGGIATSAVRGGSAGHTLVTWNGIPLQSPMLGLLDLSLLPLGALSSVTFERGGGSALWGSGAVAGSIGLESGFAPSNEMRLRTDTRTGSFGRFGQDILFQYGLGRWRSSTSVTYLRADNDFSFRPAPGLTRRRQANAGLGRGALVQSLGVRLGEDWQVDLHYWGQTTHRRIPPTTVQTSSLAEQDDRAHRALLDVRRTTARGLWCYKLAHLAERLDYRDPAIRLNAPSGFGTWLTELTWQLSPHKNERHRLLLGTTHRGTRARAQGYRDHTPREYRAALFASWRYRSPRLRAQVSLRGEVVNGRALPPVPVVGLERAFHPHWTLVAKVSRDYRLPTLNDRFWRPGGNPDLRPETGWSQELGLQYRRPGPRWEWAGSLTGFHRHLRDWILWAPLNNSFWSATNLNRVRSRGLEARATATRPLGKGSLRLHAAYDFVRATNLTAVELPRMAAGEQLLYTPGHRALLSAQLTHGPFNVRYHHRWTAAVRGVNAPVPAWNVGDLYVHYRRAFDHHEGTLYLQLQNLWNREFRIVERRPLPGINYEIGVRLQLQKPST